MLENIILIVSLLVFFLIYIIFFSRSHNLSRKIIGIILFGILFIFITILGGSYYKLSPPLSPSPTLDISQIQGTALLAANTLMAMTQAALPTSTNIPPSPLPSMTPFALPTLDSGTPFIIPTIEPLVSFTPISNQSPLIGDVFVKSQTQSDGAINNIVDLSISSIGIGQLSLSLPPQMNLGDSGFVRLSITPNNKLAKLISVTVPTQNSNSLLKPFQFTDNIDIYPVMSADLSGAGFDISSNDQSEKVILSNRPTEWIWTIKAIEEGSQSLLVRISIPARVNGVEQPISTSLKNIPAQIEVIKSLRRQFEDFSPYLVPSLIGLVGVLIGVYANNLIRKGKKKY